MLPDDDLIIILAKEFENGAAMRDRCRLYAQNQAYLADKAYWAYTKSCTSLKHYRISREHFVIDYLDAWADFIYYAVAAVNHRWMELPLNIYQGNCLYLCWHFPEYPLLLHATNKINALTLIAQESKWMSCVASPDNLYNWRAANAPIRILRALKSGKPLVAMIDYCYDETVYTVADFLGFPSRTPSGIFTLARSFNYHIQLISFDQGECFVGLDLSPAAITTDAAVQLLNNCIQREIFKNPARWLLWPSVDRRWIGAVQGPSVS